MLSFFLGPRHIVRTCSADMNLKLHYSYVCMEESRPGDGMLCFCHRDLCNHGSSSLKYIHIARFQHILFTVTLSCIALMLSSSEYFTSSSRNQWHSASSASDSTSENEYINNVNQEGVYKRCVHSSKQLYMLQNNAGNYISKTIPNMSNTTSTRVQIKPSEATIGDKANRSDTLPVVNKRDTFTCHVCTFSNRRFNWLPRYNIYFRNKNNTTQG